MTRKKFSYLCRMSIDAVMLMVFLACFGMRFTEEALHEILGIAALLLVFLHLYAGRMWFFTFQKRQKKAKQRGAVMLCLLLVISMALLFGTGFFLFARPDAELYVRKLHTVSAYWMLVLSGLHTGLYCENILTYLCQNRNHGHAMRIFFNGVLYVFTFIGIWACFELPLVEKLMYGVSFDFWPEQRPVILFFIVRLGIFCLFGTLLHVVIATSKKFNAVNVSTGEPLN